MLQVACPGCGEKFAIHPAMAGKQVQCPGCKAAVVPGGGTRSVSSDDYTGKVELGARMMKGKSGGEGTALSLPPLLATLLRLTRPS